MAKKIRLKDGDEVLYPETDWSIVKSKPKINAIELNGDQSFNDLGLRGLEETDILSAIYEAEHS